MKKNNILRSAIKVSSVVLVNILIVLTVLYIIHLYYLKTIQKPNQRASFESLSIPHISKETLMKLGSFSNNYKNSSFVHFKKEKPSRDIIRIGCFGDSHTYCDEVNEKNDFPSLLQTLLGTDKFEVLNFGMSGFSFHRAYILWEEVGKGFNLDYLVLGPVGFYETRNQTFNRASERSPYCLHSRFILKDNMPYRLDPLGNTIQERFDRYHSFFPEWQYLRYDTHLSGFLKSLSYFLARRADNPFYYRKDATSEIRETYLQLIKRMAASGTEILIVTYDEEHFQLFSRLRHPQITVWKIYDHRDTFPYRAPATHSSPFGNLRVALQVAAFFQEGQKKSIPLWDLEDSPGDWSQVSGQSTPLKEAKEISLLIEGKNVGKLGTAIHPEINKTGNILKEKRIKALVGFTGQGKPSAGALFTSFPVQGTVKIEGVSAEIRYLKTNSKVVVVSLPQAFINCYRRTIWVPERIFLEKHNDEDDYMIKIDGKTVLRGRNFRMFGKKRFVELEFLTSDIIRFHISGGLDLNLFDMTAPSRVEIKIKS